MAPLTTLLRPRSLFNRGLSTPCAAVFALFSCVFASSSSAQSCVTPTLITQINTTYSFDTCTSSYRPSVLCVDLFPAAPAVVYQVNLRYSSGGTRLIIVPSVMAPNFDPLVVIQRGQCGETAPCPLAIDETGPGGTEQLLLGQQLDSGTYFIVVTSFGFNNCGAASLSIDGFLPLNDPDGIFRAGLDL